jgi:ribonuclease VapC
VIVDASALIAIVRLEPDAAVYAQALAHASANLISAATYVEAAAVADSSGDAVASRRFDALMKSARIKIAAVTEAQALLARDAYKDFGKGRGHPAKLNFGDCFSYALAKDRDEPLLFKGKDFTHTDVTPALPTA